MNHRPLNRAKAHVDALLGRKLPTDNVGIADMAP